MDNPEHWADIVSTVGELFCVPDLPAIYEGDTICIFVPSGNEICGGECCRAAISIADMSGFPVDVVEKVKVAILKQKNQIVDIDGYVHVINGKVICFKSDVYDLNNLKHVRKLLDLSVRMRFNDGDDKFYYRAYGDDTIIFLDRNPDSSNELVETMGGLRYMPEDYRKKIEEVLSNFC